MEFALLESLRLIYENVPIWLADYDSFHLFWHFDRGNIVEALPVELLCLFSSEVSFATFLCLAFAIAHDLHTGNIPLKRFIPSWCAVFLVMSSLRCPKYSWARLMLILKIFFASSFRLSRLELSDTIDATSKLSGSCVSCLLKIAHYSAPRLV
jgi:hypothetical protein